MSFERLNIYNEMINELHRLQVIEIREMLKSGLGVKRIETSDLIDLNTVVSKDQRFLDAVVGLDLEGFYDKDGNKLKKPDDAKLYAIGD